MVECSQLPPVAPGIFGRTAEGGPFELIGGACASCGGRFFPRPARCPACLAPVEAAGLGSRGTLYSFTSVRVRPPLGLPQPYGVGYVDLEGSGLRVFTLLDPERLEDFEIGAPVRLAVGPLGHDGSGNACLRPFFTLVDP